jgi:hypothetical protein
MRNGRKKETMKYNHNEYLQSLNLGKKPGPRRKYPLSWEDNKALSSRATVKERPKGFLDWGGLVEWLDKARGDFLKLAALSECPQERERLKERGETANKIADKLYQLHEAGYGLPERICVCGQAYVAPGKQLCEGCREKNRRASNRKAKLKQREKAKPALTVVSKRQQSRPTTGNSK